jgi:hypothetical protein
MEPIGDSIREAQETRSRASKHFKQFGLAIVSTSLLVLDWWLFREALFGGQPVSFWIWPIVTAAVWIATASFFALVNPDRVTFFIFNVIGLIAYLAVMPRDPYIFAGGAVFFLLSLMFQRRIQDEEKNQLNFSIRRTMGNSQAVIVYALIIMVGFVVYSRINEDFKRNPDDFYRRLGETAVRGVPYLSEDRSQFNLNQTVGEFFRKQAQEEYPQFNQVSRDQQEMLLSQIRDSFRQQFGIDASENATLRVAMTQVITERLRESLGRYERFFPLFFTIALIALLRTFSFVFSWAVLLISWILFKVMLAARFFRLEKQTVEVEKVEI